MTKDEIISMAKQCGLPLTYVPHYDGTFSPHVDGLARFATLVSTRAAAIEREACADVVFEIMYLPKYNYCWSALYRAQEAIRARGESA